MRFGEWRGGAEVMRRREDVAVGGKEHKERGEDASAFSWSAASSVSMCIY